MSKFVPKVVNVRPKVVLLGDSITQQSFATQFHGWGASLADWFGRSVDVINRGYSGYNSRFLKIMLPKLFPEPDSNIIMATILLGANDSSNGAQNVPLEEYERNLYYMIDYCHFINPKMEVVLITPSTVDHAQWSDRHPSTAAQYARKVVDIGQALSSQGNHHIHVINVWDENVLKLPSEWTIHRWNKRKGTILPPIDLVDLHDGLHFGIQGNEKLFHHVTTLILQKCPRLAPDYLNCKEPKENRLSLHFPHWSELVDKTPEEVETLLSQWHWK